MFKFEHLKETVAVFTSSAISNHEKSFEIKHTIKHNLRLKLRNSQAYRASTQFTCTLRKKECIRDTKDFLIKLSSIKNIPEVFLLLWTFHPFTPTLIMRNVPERPVLKSQKREKINPFHLLSPKIQKFNSHDHYIESFPIWQ